MKYIKMFENFNNIDILSKEFIDSVKEVSKKLEIATENSEKAEKEFVPYFIQVIDSNNVELIQDILDYIPKKYQLHSLSFLFQRIYEVKDKIKRGIKVSIDKSINVEELKNNISEIFPKFEEIKSVEYNAEDEMDKLVDIIIESDDIRSIRIVCNYITPYYSQYRIYKRLDDLKS